MAFFDTVSSTRRSICATAAESVPTTPLRSSIRDWSETAKSTRSLLPSPTSTSCAWRTRRSVTYCKRATTSDAAAITAAAIAIQTAVEALTLTLRQREEHAVRRLVVRRVHLAGHARHEHCHRRARPERRGRDVEAGEGHRLLRAGADRVDRLALDDRLAASRVDRQGHGHVELLEVAGVLDGDREREVAR